MANPQPEPSMEEILASIRRIISEDEEEPAATPPSVRPPAPAAVHREPQPFRAAPPPEDEADDHLATEDVEMIKKNVAEALADNEDTIVDETTAAAASSAFRNLSASVRVTESGQGRTLEDIVTEMLRPMIKDWLDDNLAAIVEEKVEEEVQRVARRRR